MKKFLMFLIVGLFLLGFLGTASALNVDIYVDSAPNVYGSPDYPGWAATTFQSVADGTFVNMGNGINPDNIGTTNFEIEDEVVYSFGDLGKRLTWIYWVAGETVESLENGRFQISLFNTWDGDVLDFYDFYYGSTWVTPTKWQDYDADGDGISDGVIGTAGMAWWGAYGINTQEALDADIAAWGLASETWEFTARLDGEEYSILCKREPVPEPATMFLFGSGLLGFAVRMKKKKK